MGESYVYTTKPKGLPSFSGRSTAHMHACLAPFMKSVATGQKAVAKQQKQRGKK